MELDGKICVVTGSTRGIGKAIALSFVNAGAIVVVNGRNISKTKRVVREIDPTGERVVPLAADVGNKVQVKNMFDEIYKRFKRVDVLVNNAAIFEVVSMLRMTEKQWDRIMQVNLKGAFYCVKSVLDRMVKQDSGNIINIVSVSGKFGGKLPVSHYAASKAALICLTKSWATEFAGKGIRVNAVCPGIINTEMSKKIISEFEKIIPLKHAGGPEDVAETVLFLASDKSKYITGEIIDVNGGLVMD